MRAAKKPVIHREEIPDLKDWRDDDDPVDRAAALPAQAAPRPFKVQLNILTALAIIAFLYFAKAVVLPILLAAVGAMALKPLVQWLQRRHVPRPFGAGLIVATPALVPSALVLLNSVNPR